MAEEASEALAIDGGTAVRRESWPAAPAVDPAADAQPVSTLEAEFAAALGLDGSLVIAVSSAAEARRIALQVAVEGRREIVLPALGADAWVAAAEGAGLTVVPAETDSDSAALSARGLSAAATPETAAVIVTYPFGHPAVLDTIVPVVREHACSLIEDGTEGIGASYRGAPAGSIGNAAVFALGGHHLLSGGIPEGDDGGALVVLREPAAAMRVRGQVTPLAEPVARVALAEWRGREESLRLRRQLAWELTFNLRGMRGIASMTHGRWIRHGYDRYVFRLRSMLWKRGFDETLHAIRAEGVPVEAALAPSLAGEVPISEDRTQAASRLPREMVALPLHPGMTSRDMDQIAAALRKIERWAL